MKEEQLHREQKLIINGRHIEILNFICDNKGSTVQVEILSNGRFFVVDVKKLLEAVDEHEQPKEKKQLIITECKNGYQVKTSSGKMFALESNGKNYDITSLPIQPMTGILVHGIPDKIKSIVFNLQKK